MGARAKKKKEKKKVDVKPQVLMAFFFSPNWTLKDNWNLQPELPEWGSGDIQKVKYWKQKGDGLLKHDDGIK